MHLPAKFLFFEAQVSAAFLKELELSVPCAMSWISRVILKAGAYSERENSWETRQTRHQCYGVMILEFPFVKNVKRRHQRMKMLDQDPMQGQKSQESGSSTQPRHAKCE